MPKRNTQTIERRRTGRKAGMPQLTKRDDGDAAQIVGYGAVYYREDDPGSEYWLWDDIVERITDGAFDRAIKEDDVRSLFNHDANYVLGRNQGDAASLVLSSDDVGLRYTVTPPDSQTIRDLVVEPIRRGDVSGSSFMFVPTRTAWVEEKDGDDKTIFIRQIEEVRLYEVGPVVFPAYDSATSGIRAASEADVHLVRDELETWKRSGRPETIWQDTEAEVSLRLKLAAAGL